VASGSDLWIMRTVGLKDLENELAEYVRIAAAGERVLIVDRDRVVAELVPPDSGREGVVTPPLSPGGELRVKHPRGSTPAEMLGELDGDRGER
jgi:antitoxin (DNA-binding transcriptional repressor) of toxin-antitoxin stability system